MLAVTTFKTMEEALELANDTQYGLGAGVWSLLSFNAILFKILKTLSSHFCKFLFARV